MPFTTLQPVAIPNEDVLPPPSQKEQRKRKLNFLLKAAQMAPIKSHSRPTNFIDTRRTTTTFVVATVAST
jgi:hypothetical protein